MDFKNLIDSNGKPQFGIFDIPIENINYKDFDYRTYMDKPAGKLSKYLAAYMHHFVGLICDDVVVGAAVVDAKNAGKGFVYIFDPKNKTEDHFSYLQLFGMDTSIDTRPDNGISAFKKGKNKIEIEVSPSPRQRTLRVEIPGAIEIDALIVEPAGSQPLAFCSPNGYRGFNYTQKGTALPVSGSMTWRGKKMDLAAIKALGSYDWTCGYTPGETTWNWGMMSGLLPDGRAVGMNVCAGMNETSFTENCFWLNGRLHKVDTVNFMFDRNNRFNQWRIESYDKKISLRFEPMGTHGEKLNLIIQKVNFHQYFGKYFGEFRTDKNEVIKIDGIIGLAEDHLAKR